VSPRRLQYISVMLFAAPLYAAPVYSVVHLGSLGGGRSDTMAIAGNGVAAGVSTKADTGLHLPVAFDGTQVRTLSSSPGQANGVNGSGTVVGTTDTRSGARATVWSDAGTQLLPTLGGDEGYGLAINESGNVAGSATTASGFAHAFLTIGDSVRDLGTLGGDWSSAYGVNDRLDVVGYSLTSSRTFGAFYWTQETGMLAIPTFGGATSYAFAINERGSVVGAASTRRGTVEAFLYADGHAQSLGLLGGFASFAYGINAADQAVGYAYDARGRKRAFVWFDGIMYDLNNLVDGLDEWSLDAAYGINDRGQIVGSGTYQGNATAFRLDPVNPTLAFGLQRTSADIPSSPVPEPASSVLVLFGAVVLWLRRTHGGSRGHLTRRHRRSGWRSGNYK
jgi:probable HAF family extracellular repeat protein